MLSSARLCSSNVLTDSGRFSTSACWPAGPSPTPPFSPVVWGVAGQHIVKACLRRSISAPPAAPQAQRCFEIHLCERLIKHTAEQPVKHGTAKSRSIAHEWLNNPPLRMTNRACHCYNNVSVQSDTQKSQRVHFFPKKTWQLGCMLYNRGAQSSVFNAILWTDPS